MGCDVVTDFGCPHLRKYLKREVACYASGLKLKSRSNSALEHIIPTSLRLNLPYLILIWIYNSQWKQIFFFFKIPRSTNFFNTHKLDLCLWQEDLKCQYCYLKWNSGIQWNLGVTLNYSVSRSSLTYLSKYLKFRQHNSVLQPLQTESTKFSSDSDAKPRDF